MGVLALPLLNLGLEGWVYRYISAAPRVSGQLGIQQSVKSYRKDYGCSLMALHGNKGSPLPQKDFYSIS